MSEPRTIQTSFYVVLEGFKRSGWPRGPWNVRADRIVKTTTEQPALKRNQIPILVTIELPEALFSRPELSVKISVDADHPRVDLDADVLDSIRENIAGTLGVNVNVQAELPDDDEID